MYKITESEALRMYDEMLDEAYGDFMDAYSASRVLKSANLTMYYLGFSGYLNTLEDDGYEIVED